MINIKPNLRINSSAKNNCPNIKSKIAVVMPLGTFKVINTFSLKVKPDFEVEIWTDKNLTANKIKNKAKESMKNFKSKFIFIKLFFRKNVLAEKNIPNNKGANRYHERL